LEKGFPTCLVPPRNVFDPSSISELFLEEGRQLLLKPLSNTEGAQSNEVALQRHAGLLTLHPHEAYMTLSCPRKDSPFPAHTGFFGSPATAAAKAPAGGAQAYLPLVLTCSSHHGSAQM